MTKLLLAGAIAAGLATASPAAYAQQPSAPGQLLQGQGSAKGGAAANAPGHLMQDRGSAQGTVGASGYAPGRTGADADVGTNANVKAGGASVGGGVKAKGGANVR